MMRKFILLYFLIFYLYCSAQVETTTNKLTYYSFSFAPLSVYLDTYSGGLSFSGDVSFAYNKHMLSLGLVAGSEFVIIGRYADNFEQVNLLYGKELRLSRKLFLDLHAGVGYFSLSSTAINLNKLGEERATTLGFPIMAKFRVMISKRFSLGLQFQANANSVRTIYTMGIVLKWNKKSKF